MEWSQVWTIVGMNVALFGGNIGLLIWFRTESRNDWRHMDNKVDSYMKAIREDIKAVQEEMKDFHNRLCNIEQRNKDKIK